MYTWVERYHVSGLFEDEDSRMSGCESSEGSQSQYSMEDELSKLGVKGWHLFFSVSFSFSIELSVTLVTYYFPQSQGDL